MVPGQLSYLSSVRRPPPPRASHLDALVRCAQAGDARAFREVADTFTPTLTRYVGTMIGDGASADDVVQETLLAAWSHLHKVNDGKHLRPWLYRVARNKALTFIRRRHASPFLPLRWDEEEQVRAPEPRRAGRNQPMGDLERALRLAIGRLPCGHAQIVRLHYVYGCTTREIGDLVGVTRSTIKMRLLRSRELLAALLPDAARSVGGRARWELQAWIERTKDLGGHDETTEDRDCP